MGVRFEVEARRSILFECGVHHVLVVSGDRLMGIVKRLRLESPQSGGGGEGPLLDMGAWGLGPPAAGP